MESQPPAIPIMDFPILRLEGILCAGDLHIGIEAEYSDKGIHLPSQTHRMEQEILETRENERDLVLLGDVKHMVPGSSRQEQSEVPRFLMRMKDSFDYVHLVRGNHDGGIEEFLPEMGVKVHPSTGFRIGEVGFVHGHTWPSNEVMASSLLVMAHTHPAIMFKDNLGRTTTEPCWLRCVFKEHGGRYTELPDELIVIPALNRSMGGSPINLEGKKLLGPLLQSDLIDLENARVYLLDGIFLGRLKDLRIQRSK
jgi:putative SbcD/Mre11-related phosphoesterase